MYSCLVIIVSYNPDVSVLKKQIALLLPQASKILLIDNASVNNPCQLVLQDLKTSEVSRIMTHRFLSNKGLATAYNYGINFARQQQFTHVLLMDQDSLPELNMLAELFSAEKMLLSQGVRTAATGANYSDREEHKTIYINSKKCPVKRCFCTQQKQLIACDHVISSGSLIALEVINQVGLMDESLFIDLVDVDWGLKAQSLGYDCYAVCSAKMHHAIGDERLSISLINRNVNIHSSLRYYYQFRNSFLLYKKQYTSWCWIRYHFPRHIILKLFYCLFFSRPKLKNLRMMLLGIYHGIIGKTGKIK